MEDKKDERIEAVSKRLKEIRKSKFDCSYEVFAFENGISRTQVYRLECKDSCNPKLSNFIKILDALDVSLFEFFDAEEFKQKGSKE